MNSGEFSNSIHLYPQHDPNRRLWALWYFTSLLIVWTILGHTVLGFEQSWAQPVVGVVSACAVHFLLEWVEAKAQRRRLRFAGGLSTVVHFLPSAIIPGLAVAMLLYPNDRLWPIAFAAALSIASKVLFRAPLGNGQSLHVFNPSNFGISATLILFPSVGLAPPYHFTENLTGAWHWILPGVILLSGIIIHSLFTGRLPLCLAWLGGFIVQGIARSWIFNIPWIVPFVPMTSAAFILFTLYMIPDPATTPLNPHRQIVFGVAIAAIYGVLLVMHVVFGLFIALVAVCAIRGLGLHLLAWRQALAPIQTSVSRPKVATERALS